MLILLYYPVNILFFIFVLNGVKLGYERDGVKSLRIFRFFYDYSNILFLDLDLDFSPALYGVS